MMETVGTRIKAFREFHNLTQKDVFQATHGEIKQTTLSAVENNQAKPGFDTLTALLDAYPVLNSDWLLRGVGTMLRDGRVLVPIAPEPAADYSSAGSTEQTLYISVLKEQVLDLKSQVADLKEDKADLRAEVQELRGKPSDSSDAADALGQPAPTAPMPRLRVQRVHGLRRYQ